MKIYFTDTGGLRELQECNLSEIKLTDKVATDGITERPMYRICNESFGNDKKAITFGGVTDIGKNLRDAFWNGVSNTLKRGLSIFDVDEWYSNIKFVTPEEKEQTDKKKKKK